MQHTQPINPFTASVLAALIDAFRQGASDAVMGVQNPSHKAFIAASSLPRGALRILQRIATDGPTGSALLTFARPVKGRCAWVLWTPNQSADTVGELADQTAEPILALVRLSLAEWREVPSPCKAVLVATEQGRRVAQRVHREQQMGTGRADTADCPKPTHVILRKWAQQITTIDFRLRDTGDVARVGTHIADALRRSYDLGLVMPRTAVAAPVAPNFAKTAVQLA